MVRRIMILPLGIALLLSLTVDAAPVSLAALCKFDKVELKTVAELEALKAEVDANSAGCPERVVEAIKDLAAMVKDKQACRMDKAEAITKFVDDYLRQSPAEIPEALANFAVAYGMRVSRICSEEMVGDFASHADARLHDKLSPDQYQELLHYQEHLVENSPMSLILLPVLKTGNLILPADLLDAIPELGLTKRLNLELPESEQLARFKGYCKNILQPLYEPTLLPLAHLNRAGFISNLNKKSSQHRENSQFWSTVVFLCESFKMIKLEPVESAEKAMVAREIQDMATGLADQIKLEDTSEGVQLVADTPMKSYESEQQIDGEIVSGSVRSLVKKFDANKNEATHIRERIQRRSAQIIKALLKKSKYRPTLRKILKMIKLKGGNKDAQLESIRTAIAKLENSNELDWSMSSVLQGAGREVSAHEQKGITKIAAVLILGSLLIGAVFLVGLCSRALRRRELFPGARL